MSLNLSLDRIHAMTKASRMQMTIDEVTVDCRTCLRRGVILVGWTQEASYYTPPQPIEDECPVCLGHGEVRVWELEAFGGEFPTEKEAQEILERRTRWADPDDARDTLEDR